MKKAIFTAVLMFLGTSFAQNSRTVPVGIAKEKEITDTVEKDQGNGKENLPPGGRLKDITSGPSPRRLIAEIGVSHLGYVGNRGFDEYTEPESDGALGLLIQYKVSEKLRLATGLRAVDLFEDNESFISGLFTDDRFSVKGEYLTIPFLARWDILGKESFFFAQAGVSLAYLMDVTQSVEDGTNTVDTDLTSKFNRFDIWPSIGLGVDIAINNGLYILVDYNFVAGVLDAIKDDSIAPGKQHVEGSIISAALALPF